MIHLSLSEMAKILAVANPTTNATIHGISTDTRHLTRGNLFVAIQGEQFDGHQFVGQAHQLGATATLVNHHIDSPIPQLIVKDTILAFGQIAEAWRDRFHLPLIGVTGSNGKTTLKNMIASILRAASNKDAVLATEGNLNNNIGVPIMLSRLQESHRYGVIEMGMNHFGEIAYLTKFVKPQVAVVNNAAAAHLQGLEDVAGVARAKGEIFLGLPKDGVAILNRDDAFFEYWCSLVRPHTQLTFGLENSADVTATLGNTVTVHTPKGNFELNLPLLGKHNIMNALAATAATLAINIDITAIKKGLEAVTPAPGRLRQHRLANGLTLIDDTYNANPASARAAIHTLSAMPNTKILVLGDMRELGKDAEQLHFTIGQQAKEAGIQHLFTLGELSRAANQAFGESAKHFTTHDALVTALQPYMKKDTTILIKGSRSMRMEKVVAGLVPELANENAH